MEKVIDMAIVGAGPAGMTAAIYGQRAGLSVVILEKNTMGGGQMTYTDKIENYTGLLNGPVICANTLTLPEKSPFSSILAGSKSLVSTTILSTGTPVFSKIRP